MDLECLQIIGPPGTGKTQSLLRILGELAQRIPIDKILFCSFTRAAIREASRRVQEQLGVNRQELVYFGTIHSICFQHLGLTRKNVVSYHHRKQFCDAQNMKLTPQADPALEQALDEPWEPIGQEEGDVFFQWYDWARNCCLPLEEAAAAFDPPESVPWNRDRMVRLAYEYEAFKREQGLFDFTQMLTNVALEGWVPPVKVLVLDEAQDLSPLQQRLFLNWAKERVAYIGADEDQTIYTFQGADPTWLLKLPGERFFLQQSHRVPQQIRNLAVRLITKNRRRYNKNWLPTSRPGRVYLDTDFELLIPEIARQDATWFLLARNNIYLQFYATKLLHHGIPYVNLRGTSPLAKIPRSILTALKIASGQKIAMGELQALARDVPATPWFRHGAKAELERRAKEDPNQSVRFSDLGYLGGTPLLVEKLGRVETCLVPLKKLEGTKEYFLKVYQRYGFAGLQDRPKVTLSSIHGVKGREADNVVLLPHLTRRTEDGYAADPEPERRVWYVGVTRAKERLYILEPFQRRIFEDW